jgi:hypothetical protein
MRCTIGALVLSGVCGCAPPPGRIANAVYFWRLLSPSVSTDTCSNADDFTAQLAVPMLKENTFFVYRVSLDRTLATEQTCARTFESDCQDAEPLRTFIFEGENLFRLEESQRPIGTTGCVISQALRFRFAREGTTGTLSIESAWSFAADDPACTLFDAELRARSPNGHGIAGCRITNRFDAQLR